MLISDMEVVKLNVQSGKLDYADKFAIADLPVLRSGEGAGKLHDHALRRRPRRHPQIPVQPHRQRSGAAGDLQSMSASDRRCLWP